MNGEELFHRASRLFGMSSQITTSLQNHGILRQDDDVETIIKTVGTCVKNKEEEFKEYRVSCRNFVEELRTAYMKGMLDK